VTAKTVKIVAFLLPALMSLAATVAAAPNEPMRPNAPLPDSIFARDPNFAFGTGRQFDTGGIYWRMILAVLLVLVLGIAAYYVSKKLGAKIVNLPNRQIRLVETLYLGSRKVLYLIKVGDRSIIIGTTPTTITRIADLSQVTGNPSATDESK
jgi:flagellar biosynthetic protein FliO